MPWIRVDCSTQGDEWIESLKPGERWAWLMFLLRVRSHGARGRVRAVPIRNLARDWRLSVSAVEGMLRKAGGRIKEQNGVWYVVNWSRYQDEKGAAVPETAQPIEIQDNSGSPEIPRNGATPPHPTPPHPTPLKEATPPNVETVTDYMKAIGIGDYGREGQKFWDHFSSNGWRVGGKSPMRDWKAACRTWKARYVERGGKLTAELRERKPQRIVCVDHGIEHDAFELCPKCQEEVDRADGDRDRVRGEIGGLVEKMKRQGGQP